MPNADDLILRLHRLTKHANISADLEQRFSEPRPEFDPKIHVIPNWEELSMDTVDVELEFVREKWNGRLEQWDWERVREWSVDVGRALEEIYDDGSTKMRNIGEGDAQQTDSTTDQHGAGETNKQSLLKVDATNKHGRSESDGDVPVKRRRSEPQGATEH